MAQKASEADNEINVEKILQQQEEQRKNAALREYPFCGGDAEMTLPTFSSTRNTYNYSGTVKCKICGATVSAHERELYQVMAKYLSAKWNRRYTPGDSGKIMESKT